MFGFRLMMRLGCAALRWLQQPPVRRSRSTPSRTRRSVEALSDRLLPSVDVTGLTHVTLPELEASADPAKMRFVEIPHSGSWLPYWESQAFPISLQEMSDIVRRASDLEQLDTASVTADTVEVGGQTALLLGFRFGCSVRIDLVVGGEVAGSPDGRGCDAASPPAVVGGFVDVYSDVGERRFVMHNSGVEPNWQGKPFLPEVLSLANYAGEANPTQAASAASSTFGRIEPTNTAPPPPTTGSSLATFVAGWSGGKQIAGSLAAQPADDAPANGTAEVAVNHPGKPAEVLLTVDMVLPDANADLVRLQNADLAIVPTYLVGNGPIAPVAPPRTDERPHISLTTHVLGLDELPGGVSRALVSTDQLLERRASADGGRGVEGQSLSAEAGVQPDGIEVCDAPAAAPTDAGLALREGLDSLLNQGGRGTRVIAAMAVEGLLVAYVYRQRLASRTSNSRVHDQGGQVAREDPTPLAPTPNP
jgi:hypothetical protein